MQQNNVLSNEEAPYTEAELEMIRLKQQVAISLATALEDTDKAEMLASMDLNTFDDYDLRNRLRRFLIIGC